MTTSAQVPGRYPVAINGRAFMIDPAGYKRESLQVLRQQSDTSDLPSETSLNPRGLWRRSQESWHHGAGQTFLDGKVSGTAADPERFFSSSGLDIWTRGQFSLAAQTVALRTGASVGPMVAAANHLYVADGQQLYWSLNPTTTSPTWTSSVINAGQAAAYPLSLATNGYYVWAAMGNSGLHRTVRGASSSTADVPSQACTLVGWALDRLLIANGPNLWEVTSPLGTPALNLLYTHPDGDFSWKFISPGRGCIYAGGNSLGDTLDLSVGADQGANGFVYKITMVPVSTALGPPSVAAYLPDGEAVYDCRFYAGGAILATGRGLRLGVVDGAGNIDYGPLIASAKPVLGLEPQDRYVWYSSPNFGLARADLGFFTDPLTPAYAEDIQIYPADADIGVVHSAASLVSSPGPVFWWYAGLASGANPTGVYRASATVKVANGILTTGAIRFGTTETKVFRRFECHHQPLPTGASITVEMNRDGGGWETIASNTVAATTKTTSVYAPLAFKSIELRITIARGTDTATGPVIIRWTLLVLPTPTRSSVFTLPLTLRSKVTTLGDDEAPVDVPAELAALVALEEAGTIVEFQVADQTYEGYIEDFVHEGEHWTKTGAPHRYIEGTWTARMVVV